MSQSKGIMEENVKKIGRLLVLSLTIAFLLLVAGAARADSVTITLSQAYQVGLDGDVIAFNGTIDNTSGVTEYLNGDNVYVDSPLVFDDSPYDLDAPLSLGPGDSYTGLLFNIDIPLTAPAGLYTGYFGITGGTTDTSLDPLEVPANFDVNVTPEPASLLLLGTGLLALLGVLTRRKALGMRVQRLQP